MATALAGDGTRARGPPPDVWVPDSSAWVRKASVDADAERIMPDLQPSLARTPTVIAMPKPLAEAAGMAEAPLTWQQIIDKLNTPEGWQAYNHAEWGAFKVGPVRPAGVDRGAAGAHGDLRHRRQRRGRRGGAGHPAGAQEGHRADDRAPPTEIFDGLARPPQDRQLTYVSAFPALEQDVLAYNLRQPTVPLVAVYPQDGTAEADFPYLVLKATKWSEPASADVAAAFLSYARGPDGQGGLPGRRFPRPQPGRPVPP